MSPPAEGVDEREPDAEGNRDNSWNRHLVPACISFLVSFGILLSLPVITSRLGRFDEVKESLYNACLKAGYFLFPALQNNDWSPPSLAEFMLQHFDSDGDGHITAQELKEMLNVTMTDKLSQLPSINVQYQPPTSWLGWVTDLMLDWKLGVFVWRTCSGLVISLAIASIVPGRLHGWAGRVIRFPILGITYFMIAVELVVYVMIRLFIRFAETLFASPRHRRLRRAMANAKTYDEWYQLANELDKSQKRDKWRQTDEDDTSYQYNWGLIRELMADLRKARDSNDAVFALAVLQQCTRKNVGGVMSEDLFSFTNTGEPKLIVSEFIDEVVATLRCITNQAKGIHGDSNGGSAGATSSWYEANLRTVVQKERTKLVGRNINMATYALSGGRPSMVAANGNGTAVATPTQQLPLEHKETVKTFLKRARAAYGRTALCLSGGSMMGQYHFGHIKALLEEDALPHIMSGTSAGSAITAFLCTRNDEEIKRDLKPHILYDKMLCFSRSWPERIISYIKTGAMFDVDEWLEMIKWFTLGDMTFLEAYRKTGRVFCITLSATTKRAPPVLVNHITAPNVVIASAIIASAAVPGFIHPVKLKVKDKDGTVRVQGNETWWDGSIEQDIPTAGLAEMLNCHFFVTAQCNPHIVPFFYNSKGDVGRPSRWSSGMREDSWRGGFLLSALEMYLKNDMRAKFTFLRDIEAVKGFHANLFSQSTYSGSTTIVPQVALIDYFKLFVNQKISDLERYFQGGTVAAYQHIAMIRLHYRIANALDECLAELEQSDGTASTKPRRRSVMLEKKNAPKRSSVVEAADDDEYEYGFDGGVDEIPHGSDKKGGV
mmetsp:Transcript_23089/g.66650  ORF Transcript_23089/g.66650 Transcript_23089/m.66650 type:complete len:831 (-) Transcript_23089:1367-3859(-)